MGFLINHREFIAGAVLAYVGAFILYFIGGNSDFTTRVVWALVWGTLTWPLFVIPQIIVQWGARSLLQRRLVMSTFKRLIVINTPVAILVVGLLVNRYL